MNVTKKKVDKAYTKHSRANVHFHSLMIKDLRMVYVHKEEAYVFQTAIGERISLFFTIWGTWMIKHNIRNSKFPHDWDDTELLGDTFTSVEVDFRMLGMGMMTPDLNNFAFNCKKHFCDKMNILKSNSDKQLALL